MPTTTESLALEAALAAQVAATIDTAETAVISAWAMAWNEVSTDLFDALLDALAAGTRVTRAQMLRAERLRKSLVHIGDRLNDLTRATGITLTGSTADVVKAAAQAQGQIIAAQLPAGLTSNRDLDQAVRISDRTLDAIVRRSNQQITSRLRPVSTETRAAIRAELIRGVAAGANPRDTARRMVLRTGGRFTGGQERALVIARTETIDAHRAGAAAGQEPHTDVLAGWRWSCDLSLRTCPACLAMHGREFELTQAGPHGHPNCRCARSVKVKPWADLGLPELEDEPQDEFRDARAWFDQLTRAQQTAILGAERLQLLRSGKVRWEDLATQRDNPDWRPAWVVTPIKTLRRRAA